jgi:hypothetical protein
VHQVQACQHQGCVLGCEGCVTQECVAHGLQLAEGGCCLDAGCQLSGVNCTLLLLLLLLRLVVLLLLV